MARTKLDVNCGCGYTAHSLEAAESHSDRTSHKMTILGTVTPIVSTPAIPAIPVGFTAPRKKAKPEADTLRDPLARIGKLRKSFNGG